MGTSQEIGLLIKAVLLLPLYHGFISWGHGIWGVGTLGFPGKNITNEETPRYIAAWFGNPEMVNLLLEAKADPEIRNNRGESYLDALNLGNKQLRLMEAILQDLGCINLVNNGISYLSTGAGCQPSTVVSRVDVESCWSTCDFCKSSRPMEVFVGQLGHCCGMMGLVGEIYRVCFLFSKSRHIYI